MPKKPTKAVAKKESTAVIGGGYADDAGAGFEHADQNAYSIPRLYMLQALSPQVGEKNPDYVEGAKAGMIFNSVTKQVVEKITVIPVLYRQSWIEWIPRKNGGGYVGEYDRIDPAWIRQTKGPFLVDSSDDANEVNDTRNFFLLLKGENSLDPAVLSLTASQIRRAMDWMTVMQNKRGQHDGRSFPLPMFANIFELSGDFSSNEKGQWYSWKIVDTGELVPSDSELYQQCKVLREQVDSGIATAVAPDSDQTDDSEVRV